MKLLLKTLPILLCFILMAAHLSRAGMAILPVLCFVIPALLFWRNKTAARIIQVLLFLFGVEWLRSLAKYVTLRIENDMDWIRLALILVIVALFNFGTIFIFRNKAMKERYGM